MQSHFSVSKYNLSLGKIVFNFILSIIIFIIFFPLFVFIFLLLAIFYKKDIFYIEERLGIKNRAFKIFKFRTMKIGSNKYKKRLKKLNEASGPVFKIKNDPRFTKIGKYLSQTGLDELPQIINVIKGDMFLVGPRPLPLEEAEKLTEKQKIRNLVKPGITSLWVINGTHNLSFKQWMRLDRKYIKEANLLMDINILLKTLFIPLKVIISWILS